MYPKSKFDQFDAIVRGKIVDDGQGNFKGECVSLIKRFLAFNGWPARSGNAISWQYNGFGGYKWIKNYPWVIPSVGDLVVFQVGPYGHIGIIGGANLMFMDVLSQNWPQGNDTNPVGVTRFDYVHPRAIGFLRFVGK